MAATNGCLKSRIPAAKVVKGGCFTGLKGLQSILNESAASGVTIADADMEQSLQSQGVMTRGQKRKAEMTLSGEPSQQKSRPLSNPSPSSCQWSSQNEPGSTKVRLKRERINTEFYPPYGARAEVSGSTCSSAVIAESASGSASVLSQHNSHSSRNTQKPSVHLSCEPESIAGSSVATIAESSEDQRSELAEDEDLQFLRSEEEDVDCLLAEESQLEDGSVERRCSEATYYDAPDRFRDQEAGTSRDQHCYDFEVSVNNLGQCASGSRSWRWSSQHWHLEREGFLI